MASKFSVFNPYDNSLIGEFSHNTSAEIDQILAKLTKGKEIQKKMSAHERAGILVKLSVLLKEHQEELAQLITTEIGKTINDSRVEIARAINTAYASSVEARCITGETIDGAAYPPVKGRLGIVLKKPLGIVVAITPFNFPINLALHKIGPAFAAGNCIFFKPGPQNYLSGKRLAELCHQAGMPEEVIQFAFPELPDLERVIAGNQVDCISFTGGTKTADAIAKNAGRKKLLFELGGNDPLILMPDGNVELAAQTAINQRFATAGQRCTASKRLFIHENVYDQFKAILIEKTKALIVGDPKAEDTFVGPVVSKQAADQVEFRINQAIKEGATCLIGNKRDGNIIYPTILENLNLASEIICDETFGPVIPLIKFTDLEEVIKIINSSNFGLQSGVFTNNIQVVEKLFEALEVGALILNDGPGFRAEHIPFGGVKDSGSGREGIKYAINEMSYLKTLVI
jgi:acyl-CoA reductase-like NAD-dependent aldehyde dehydrogenase